MLFQFPVYPEQPRFEVPLESEKKRKMFLGENNPCLLGTNKTEKRNNRLMLKLYIWIGPHKGS